jgi:hypothetical protein
MLLFVPTLINEALVEETPDVCNYDPAELQQIVAVSELQQEVAAPISDLQQEVAAPANNVCVGHVGGTIRKFALYAQKQIKKDWCFSLVVPRLASCYYSSSQV